MMREEAEEEIERRLGGGAKHVLDVGGARQPSRHATHVIDVLPYDVARKAWGRDFVERPIRPEHWVVWDICDRRPFPFPDKFFDFAICSHVLEDIRDPVHACAEVSRVAKAGYVETPSPMVELTRGVDPGGRSWVGYYHHRWLVDVEDGGLVFLLKPHFLCASRRFHFPQGYLARWQRGSMPYTSLLWEGELRAHEKVIVVREEMEQEIERIVRSVRGDTPAMKVARFRRQAWDVGVKFADHLQIRDALRPLVGRVRRWL